jgi:2-polyprenyl-3-methyl-5-hydroxy-6-metoxy-1,4-benzoquinol methylase
MSVSSEEFNNQRYGDYVAIDSEEKFFSEDVYLYKTFRELKKVFSGGKRAKILEIGCADGSFSKFLEKNGFEVFAVDIAEKAVENAKKMGIAASVCDIENGSNFATGSFDAIIACEVIEHLYDTDSFLQEVKRLVREGGYVFLSTPNLASLKNRIRLMLGKYPQYSEYRVGEKEAGHIRNYTSSALKKQLVENGFKVGKIVAPNFLCPMTKKIPRFLKLVAMRLGDVFPSLGSHIIIVAKK